MIPTPPYKVGDLVTTDFYQRKHMQNMPYKILRCYQWEGYSQTGWLVDAKPEKGKVLDGVDSAWFRPLAQQ